ncbi:Uncharacterized protein HZ326_8468 [Fusarium oxysporum f. sp. albedinis]|jgi:uncharacterized protein YqkB|nr:Uncharacterized protein HZ326_8468 [Fusarium oxysporum f. sp. albedinis]
MDPISINLSIQAASLYLQVKASINLDAEGCACGTRGVLNTQLQSLHPKSYNSYPELSKVITSSSKPIINLPRAI